MAKVFSCRDLGADCDFEARGETLDDVLQAGAVHGKEVHGIDEITPEMAAQVASLIRDE